jgi:hypothetical protein
MATRSPALHLINATICVRVAQQLISVEKFLMKIHHECAIDMSERRPLIMSGRRPLIKGFFAALRLIGGAVMSSAC